MMKTWGYEMVDDVNFATSNVNDDDSGDDVRVLIM